MTNGFRVWEKEKKDYHHNDGEGDCFVLTENGQLLWYQDEWESCAAVDEENYIVETSTGQPDKKGVELFAGDRVKIQLPLGGFWGDIATVKIGVIRFEKEFGSFIVEWEYSKNQHHITLNCDIAFTSEKVGNIHDADGEAKG